MKTFFEKHIPIDGSIIDGHWYGETGVMYQPIQKELLFGEYVQCEVFCPGCGSRTVYAGKLNDVIIVQCPLLGCLPDGMKKREDFVETTGRRCGTIFTIKVKRGKVDK